ncbi:23S rRNA pseudouridine1911/1915/1917 synthase [Succinivibrio dextrinosolvens]|uniref:23S rRNA pseudouridine(1911/1915/1917) synthase RluD n=1 Tax=Succinivibrio dextrinosolvens TaxID=83771 RepID=UPI0008E9AFEF|nr:23S rRNA pseudouridine(1911/1915/1917) synthase RluD [Succinivibrio dextrinosolvens]SFS40528.1 23S rRNA pseudouridine1911/1915/1917 synthase [Succinivibrio dextrinosolvens]
MAEKIKYIVTDELHGKRLDAALASFDDTNSRSTLGEFIKNGLVSVDGTITKKPSVKVSTGQEIEVDLPEPENLDAVPQDIPLDIIYQDEDLIVINKPVGLVVHPGAGVKDGTVMNAMLYHFPQTAQLARAGIVHRLDKDTSGLMVIALSKYAQIKLVRAISKHDVVREYEAICEGLITAGGTIDKDISRDPHNRTRMATVCDGMGREAVTHYRVMEQFREHTLLRLRLETGRTHQIRVHMASIDHPLLGDGTYGIKRLRLMKGASEELSEALRNYRHQALHAAHIEFIHPIKGEPMSFDAPIPDDFNRLIELLREDERVNGEKL